MAEVEIEIKKGKTSQDKDDELEMEEERIKSTMEKLKKEEERLKKEEERIKKEKEMLKKMEEEIKKKKQQKRKQDEQNDPFSAFSNLDTLFKGEEDTVETDKQGPVKKAFIHQNDHLHLQISYEKRRGTASTHGIMYEVKMAALIFVKLFNFGYSFYLCSNLDGAGDFDDIVVKYTREDNTAETLFIQLKHAASDNKRRSLSFFMEKPFFDLHKYFTSVCDSNLFTDSKHVIFGSDPSNVKYLIFTNANVDKSILCKANEYEVNSFLCGISMKGDILKICSYEDYEEFCNLIEKSINHRGEQLGGQLEMEISKYIETKKHKNLESILKLYNPETMEQYVNKYKNISVSKFKDFISNTRILCNQTNVNDLDVLIKDEIAKVTLSSNEMEQVFTRLIDEMTKWWENDSYYLTEKCRMWNSIMREVSRCKEREGELLNYGVRFKPEVVVEMQNNVLQKKGVINVVCHDDITTVTTLKVWQALNLNEQQNYILVSAKDYLENEQSILRTWPNWWCKTLVIDGKDDCVLSEQVIEKLKSEPEAQLIIISSEKYNPQHCDPPYHEIIDNSTLDQLDNNSQEKLITKIINFQGQYVPLSSILEGKYLTQLSGNALSHLIIDNTFILGENFDSYKNPHYIQRHIEIPYVSEIFLEKNETDTIFAFELNHEQSHIKQLFNLKMSTSERLKIDNSKKFENCNVSHKVECDYVILTKGNEAEEFNMLCERFSNVHWIKECDGILQNTEDKKIHTNNRNTSQALLLWKKSKGNIKPVRKCLMSTNTYSIDEERFIMGEIESPVIITGDPGIGKSSLLKQMATLLKKAFPTKWVVFINLPQYCDYFDKIENVLENDVIEIIKMSLNLNKSLPIFDNALDNLDNFIILLDAYDEMSPDYTRKVKQFIMFLVKLSSFVYITSRPCTEFELGNHISAIPYTVKNLNNDEARKFLTELLQEKNLEKKLRTSLTQVIAKPWSGQSKNLDTFITNPLHILMLAEICNENLKFENIQRLNILQIYTEFMRKKCEEFYKKTGADISHPYVKNDFQMFLERFFSFNKFMAVKQMFSNESLKNANKENILPGGIESAIFSQIIKIGIFETVMNNAINYTHRSYAEYFSALWLAENCSTNVATVKDIMQNKEKELIKSFYDLKCAENSPMHTAIIMFSDEKSLSTLIECGRNLTCVDIMGRSVLHLAAQYNNVKAVEQLLHHIPCLYFEDCISYTPIDYAIINHSWESMNVLLFDQFVYASEKAKIRTKLQHMKNEIIFICCAKGLQHLLMNFIENIDFKVNAEISKDMLFDEPEMNKYIYTPNCIKNTFPLLVAVENNHYELVRFLIENKCDPWVRDCNGNTALHYASRCGYIELVRYFIELGTCDKHKNKEYKFVKSQPMTYHNTEMNISNEFNIKGKIYKKKKTRNRVFLSSTVCTNENTLSKCIHKIDLENYDHETPLLLAAQCGHTHVIKYFVEKDFDINYTNNNGYTALLHACGGGHFDTVKFCIENNCNIYDLDCVDFDALLFATESGKLDLVTYLVENGCSTNHTKDSVSALLLATYKQNLDIVKYLVKNNCDINHTDDDGESALLFATRKENLEIVKYLVENGCDVNHSNKDGESALTLATKYGNIDIVKYLVEIVSNMNH